MTLPVPTGDDAAGVPPLGHLVAALEPASDVASLARVLTGALADALPEGMVRVETERSVSDRLHGRPGRAVAVEVAAGETVLTLRQAPGGRPEPLVARAVRGVVISRTPVSLTEWLTTLATELRRLAEQDASARSALQRLLLG